MAFTTHITRFPRYVRVQVSGPTSIGNFVDLIETIGQETVYWSDRFVVADLREVEGRLTPDEQVFIGEFVAQTLPHLSKLASIVPPDEITRNSERAAQERGSRLRVFVAEEEAIDWITGLNDGGGAAQMQQAQQASDSLAGH